MAHLKLVRPSGRGWGESPSRDPTGTDAHGSSHASGGLQARPSDELARVADAVRAGDHAATRTLITTIGPKMLQVVRRILGANHADVEDVTQEAAYAVVGALAAFRGECTITHFACRVAAQLALKARRREATQKRSRPPCWDLLESFSQKEGAPDSQLQRQRLAEAARALLASLPEAQAESFALHLSGYTVAEIADMTDCPSETVRSRLRLSRHALRARVTARPLLRELIKADHDE